MKKAHLLLVEDNEMFLKALKSTLERMGCSVTTAENGKTAKEIFGLENFDAVISDINMPEMNGIELTHFIKRSKPATPVILTTGFAEIKETEEAHQLGADGFLAKPFKKEELFAILEECLTPEGETQALPEEAKAATENQDLEFCKISIEDFVSGKQIRYNIFIRISASKYIKIAHEGVDLSTDRIRAFKEKNIHFLFLRKEDFQSYLSFNFNLLPKVTKSTAIDRPRKLVFLKHTSDVLLEQATQQGLSESDYSAGVVIIENTANLLVDQNEIFSLLESFKNQGDWLYHHSLAVSFYSVLIAKKTGWESSQTLIKLGMGGLLHDIGYKEIDRAVIDKPRAEITPEEVQLLESHPVRSFEILSRIKNIPDDVIQIAFQHHEDCRGLGYPQGRSRSKIHPMAKLVGLANEFCMLIFPNPKHSQQAYTAAEAFQHVSQISAAKFDPQFLHSLGLLLGLTK